MLTEDQFVPAPFDHVLVEDAQGGTHRGLVATVLDPGKARSAITATPAAASVGHVAQQTFGRTLRFSMAGGPNTYRPAPSNQF